MIPSKSQLHCDRLLLVSMHEQTRSGKGTRMSREKLNDQGADRIDRDFALRKKVPILRV